MPTAGLYDSSPMRIKNSTHAMLYALDAETGKELYSSGDQITSFAHFGGFRSRTAAFTIGTFDSTLYCFGLPIRGENSMSTTDTRVSRSCTTPCGPDWSAKARIPNRRSISTRCSTSPRRPKSTASRSTASICFFRCRTPTSIRSDDDLKRLADKLASQESARRFAGRAGLAADRRRLGDGQRRGARQLSDAGAQSLPHRQKLRDLGIRQYGVIRIDSAASPADWAKDPAATRRRSRDTFREACDIAEELRRAAGGGRRNLLGRHA